MIFRGNGGELVVVNRDFGKDYMIFRGNGGGLVGLVR